MQNLYNDATGLVRSFENDQDHLVILSKHFHDALLDLFGTLAPTEEIKERILAAARQGAQQIELIRFLGGEVHHSGFALLSLVKGSRTSEFNQLMRQTYGCTGLLALLRDAYRPFQVIHTWNTRTTLNRILIKWEPVDKVDDRSSTNDVVV